MPEIQTYISVIINIAIIFQITGVLYFFHKTRPELYESQLARHYLTYKRYRLMQISMFFVLGAITIRCVSIFINLAGGAHISTFGLLISDFAFVGMAIVLSRTYTEGLRV